MGCGLVGQTPQHSAPAPTVCRPSPLVRPGRRGPRACPLPVTARPVAGGLACSLKSAAWPPQGEACQASRRPAVGSEALRRNGASRPPGPLRPLFTLSAPMSCGSGHRQRAGQRGLGPPDPEFRGWWSFVCGDMWLPVFVGFMHFLVLCLPESVTCLFMSFAHFFSPVRGCRQLIPVPQIHHQSPDPRCPRVRLFAEARPLKR